MRRILTSRWFRSLVSLVLLATVIRLFGPTNILNSITGADPGYVVIAVLAFIASGVIGSVQWGRLLSFHGIHGGFAGNLQRYFMGLFFNYVLPGFVGGDFVRAYKASLISGHGTRAVSSTIADRVFGLFMMVLFSLSSFWLLREETAFRALPVALFMFAMLGGLIGVVSVKRAGILLNRLFGRFIPGLLHEKLAMIYREMHELTRSPATLASVAVTAFFIQVCRIGVHYFCGRAVGIDLPFYYFALFVPLMEIVASVPVSFGGIGVRETMGVALFSLAGIARADVVAYSLLATVAGFAGSLPGALAFAVSRDSHDLAEITEVEE